MITPAPVLKYAQGEDEGDEAHEGISGDATGGPQFVEPQFVEDGIGDEAHEGISGDATGGPRFGGDVPGDVFGGDNIVEAPDLGGEATDFGTGEREAVEKKFEELWGTK